MGKPNTFFVALWVLTIATPAYAIKQGTPATAFPEAIVLTAGGFVPCSGVLLSPTTVLTAGHCSLGPTVTPSFDVLAPNALDSSGKPQTAHGSRDWSPYTNDVKTSSDVRLVFLDTPITIDHYATIASAKVAPGTKVVDVGRALNGTITQNDYVSPEVTINGDASSLGLPLNYQATPDISEDGDSGGPIELEDGSHTIVALVDTDTVEQSITETTPIDMFVRLDLVRDRILAELADPDGGVLPDGGFATTTTSTTSSSSGGCNVGSPTKMDDRWSSMVGALIVGVGLCGARSRRRKKLQASGLSKKRSAV
ncbi:MAG: trypsin-like serine protease [Polyangiaceae bacterium]